MNDPTPWITPPRHEIGRILSILKSDDRDRPLKFAELNFDGRTLRYSVPTPECRWRVETLFTKEPGTIDWLESFLPGDVFVDVGANVGMYSVYAAAACRARVFAFEPESQNYAELCRNIQLNDAQRELTAYCAALSDQPVEVSRLLLRTFGSGFSFHDFGRPSRDYDAATRFAQGSVAFSLDHLVESGALPCPAHVKIDVDGHEQRVIRGMEKLLAAKRLHTLLLECDSALPATREAVVWLLQTGWRVNADQLRLNRYGLRPGAAVLDEVHGGRFIGNIIFGRQDEDLAFATRALARFTPAQLEAMTLRA